MNALEKLLAPYAAATSGAASTDETLMADPIYATLFPSLVATQRRNRPNTDGAPSSLIALARQLERKGFEIGELEGFQGQGEISSGHVDNSYHYRGRAFDANYYGDGKWENETQALNWLNRFLQRKYDPTELLWQTDNHYDHLHFAL